ncbi:alpha,alpha-trehalase [Aquimarina brevivitae]|uniref:Alpha,alpha-trehalase n=1 Tax=Aquimarina brevivitae TaxID=323412 RepID=A0A4Q7PEX8_9FLAO|nr:alpha,alpha-trehalase [Aquimarina brevivitae]RZS98865.1 alpha,alpha-trehalase [Aquimarina brevivitae]
MKPYQLHDCKLYILLLIVCLGCATRNDEQKKYTTIMQALLQQEDTDGDNKITVEDKGAKSFTFKTKSGAEITIKGTYHLSNLLQELAISSEIDTLRLDRITEKPAFRISRLIANQYWDTLTRSIDKAGLEKVLQDTKSTVDTLRIYIPYKDTEAFQYFNGLQENISRLAVVQLPKNITPQYVKSINSKPGILNLDYTIAQGKLKGKPFVVPGGRFNEMYGWDSYFESLGLLVDHREDLVIAMADNFAYQINHYGKILNANRSYYLTRTQPPFYSSLVRAIYENNTNTSKSWLQKQLQAILMEYFKVWMQKGIRQTENGLNRYFAQGIGIPPETEEGHYNQVLKTYALTYQTTIEDFVNKYQKGKVKEPQVDSYFSHDRSMRESGHDTSNRLVAICADLNTVGLNSLLFKYEMDIAYLIETAFDNSFQFRDVTYDAQYWKEKAEERKKLMNELMWNEQEGTFYDYNHTKQQQEEVIAATNYYPLWAGLCSEQQAATMVNHLFKNLVQKGGVAGTTKFSESSNAPQRQWDHPFGWAPHQMILWRGLLNYGYKQEAQQLIYRWLWMITKNAVEYNGTIPEKYDVVNCTHKVYAEYGNVGTDFDYITSSGFGWMNASYQLGLHLLDENRIEDLNNLIDPDIIFKEKAFKENNMQ